MNAPAIELYDVIDEGELNPLTITGPIKDMLNSQMVVLLVDAAKKMIYLWKGSSAKVRKKFIAARVSQDLRGQKGLAFKVVSIDQSDEPQAFIQLVGGPIPMDSSPDPFPSGVAAPAGGMLPTTTVGPPPPPPAQPQQTVSPPPQQPTIMTAAPISQPGGAQVQVPGNIEEGVKNIIYEIEKRPPPAPYTRELVFIGPYAFSIAETKKTAFGQEQVERRWEVASPPEGQFIAKGYIPRAIVQSGKVLAIEFMKGGEAGGGGSSDAQIQVFTIKYQK